MIDTKQKLYLACKQYIESRLKNIKQVIDSNQSALSSETKSSAGDKHETGRAMLQLEIEKASQQLTSVKVMQETVKKITLEKTATISLGSLVITDKASYFLAISVGKMTIDKTDYYAISASSPIGKQILGKKVGDTILFNNAQILEVY